MYLLTYKYLHCVCSVLHKEGFSGKWEGFSQLFLPRGLAAYEKWSGISQKVSHVTMHTLRRPWPRVYKYRTDSMTLPCFMQQPPLIGSPSCIWWISPQSHPRKTNKTGGRISKHELNRKEKVLMQVGWVMVLVPCFIKTTELFFIFLQYRTFLSFLLPASFDFQGTLTVISTWGHRNPISRYQEVPD